jgi:hypothetical protein
MTCGEGLYDMNWQSGKLPTLSHLEFHKTVIEGLAGNFKKIAQKRGRPSEWETAPNSVT